MLQIIAGNRETGQKWSVDLLEGGMGRNMPSKVPDVVRLKWGDTPFNQGVSGDKSLVYTGFVPH